MKVLKYGALLLAAVLVLNGCSSTGDTKEEDADSAVLNGEGGAGAGGPQIGKYNGGRGGAYGAGGAGGRYGSSGNYAGAGEAALNDPNSPLSKRVIYFMYDSSEVMPEYVSVINEHAAFLSGNPGFNAVLEGHADERGSSEYNIALGEQRAKSVARMMQLQGATDAQIQIVSFGEEKPAVSGHDESAYQQNRRVEIVYPGH